MAGAASQSSSCLASRGEGFGEPAPNNGSVATVELERTLVKSPPELFDELASAAGLNRWLGDVQIRDAQSPTRIAWSARASEGVIELEPSGWGTRVRALAKTNGMPAWDRIRKNHELERCLRALLDDLGSSSLKKN
jgi:hypothetical protein